MHWSCWCHRSLLFLGMKILVLLVLTIAPRIHYLSKVNGAAFSLIMIMLQAKFLFVRVHLLAISNILLEENKYNFLKDEHIKSCSLNFIESKGTSLCVWNKIYFLQLTEIFACLPYCTCDKSVHCTKIV